MTTPTHWISVNPGHARDVAKIPVDQQQFVVPFWHQQPSSPSSKSFLCPFLTHAERQLQVVFTTSTFQKVAATWLAD